jgi:hypothetical protein
MILRATLLAAAAALPYLLLEPASADLAAQQFRADLAAEHGWVLWNHAWYGGHLVPGYSLTFPPLAALIGARLLGALAAVGAAAAFAVIAERAYGERARLGVYWFAIGTATMLYTGRLTFALGTAVAIAAVLLAQRRRSWGAGTLAALAVVSSPVAGLFAGLAGAAAWLGGYRREGTPLVLGAALMLAAVVLAFPTEGHHPLEFGTFLPAVLLAGGALLLLPSGHRTLRAGAVLYAALALAALLIDSPLGGNVMRFGALLAGPVAALALAGRRNVALAVVALPLLYWQWTAPIHDLADAVGDPSTEAAYYEPLLAELDERSGGAIARVHVPPSRNRWEAVHVAERYPLARGWLRQLEAEDFEAFRVGELDRDSYRAWLADRGVSFVAVGDAQPDYLSDAERRLIDAGALGDPVWENEHWRLYDVKLPGRALVRGPGRLLELGPDGFTVAASGPVSVAATYTPYFSVVAGEACVEPDPARGDRWTRIVPADPVSAGARETFRVEARLTLEGLLRRADECRPLSPP